MTELPTGTVTFLFTDIEGSTRLWEEYPEAMQDASPATTTCSAGDRGPHGLIVKTTGDGVTRVRHRGRRVDAAVAAQRAFDTEAWA